ncbi:MAG TPA: hypothetical protein VG939_05990 [Caulobacteraceae bacterium]|nr:hypothetical protein [Caulobacteraceae bacterium]
MTSRIRNLGAAGAIVLLGLLAGCATATDAPAGAYKVGAAYQVTLGREWSDVSAMLGVHERGMRVLSVDGPLLNRLYLSEGLAPGESMVHSTVKEKPTPTVKADFTPQETVEFVADSVAALGYLKVESANLRPGRFGDTDGVMFDLTGTTSEGLDVRGEGMTAVRGGKLYVILFLAPTEHYFGDGQAEAESIMRSARFGA